MNAAEHIVESYFRLCRGRFTFSDRKVSGGVNRQLDILGYNLNEKSMAARGQWLSSSLRSRRTMKLSGTPEWMRF
jgi:hypothetical protein